VRDVVSGKSSRCYLIEQWQKSLKIMAIDDDHIGLAGERASGG
jgi:hypothetical protein